MNEQKIKEVFSDAAYVKSLFELETPEQVQTSLADKGIDATVDEVKKLADLLQKKANGELKDEELEAVAGGSLFMPIVIAVCLSGAVGSGIYAYKDARKNGLSW